MEDLEKDADLVIKAEALEKAERAKKRRFTRRGLVLSLIGLVFIGIGIYLNTGPASSEGFFVAVGVIILISGIISFLIGVINPFFSDVVRRRRERQRTDTENTEIE
jgi:hypothetical protein